MRIEILAGALTWMAVLGCGNDAAETPPPPPVVAPPPAVPTPAAPAGSQVPPAAQAPAAPGMPVIPGVPGMPAGFPTGVIPGLTAGSGPVVNWRQLAEIVPASVAGLAARGELQGSTMDMGGMQVSRVERDYGASPREIELEILDANLAPALRAAFAMVHMMREDSTEGVKQGVTVAGNPGWMEYHNASKRSEVHLLVGGRFIVQLKVHEAQNAEEAQTIAATLDLAKLAALQPQPAAPPTTAAPATP